MPMILAKSSSSFLEYIVPLLLMVGYIVFSGRKEKKEPVVHRRPPPLTETEEPVLHSEIEEPRFDSSIESRQYVSSIQDKEINSEGMLKHIQTVAPAVKKRTTKARSLLKSTTSLRNAFLLQEIFRRPYD
ncbi:MAG: hypothetical protein HYX67_16930 [Candidatus Melainabacteria bacterium]|nr:hypothetical protein [Candidatus Melainabacteria bacterium]